MKKLISNNKRLTFERLKESDFKIKINKHALKWQNYLHKIISGFAKNHKNYLMFKIKCVNKVIYLWFQVMYPSTQYPMIANINYHYL